LLLPFWASVSSVEGPTSFGIWKYLGVSAEVSAQIRVLSCRDAWFCLEEWQEEPWLLGWWRYVRLFVHTLILIHFESINPFLAREVQSDEQKPVSNSSRVSPPKLLSVVSCFSFVSICLLLRNPHQRHSWIFHIRAKGTRRTGKEYS
jgi:hypothetical protein